MAGGASVSITYVCAGLSAWTSVAPPLGLGSCQRAECGWTLCQTVPRSRLHSAAEPQPKAPQKFVRGANIFQVSSTERASESIGFDRTGP